jgi:hypothetical protein
MQMNPNIKNNTLIGESSAVREEVEARIKYTEEYADF